MDSRRRARLNEPLYVTICVACCNAIHDCTCEPDGGPEPQTVRRRYISMTAHQRLRQQLVAMEVEAE